MTVSTCSAPRLRGSVGTKTKFSWLGGDGKYSWIKTPKWKGHTMEVGPLARVVIGYALGKEVYKEPVDALLKEMNLPLEAVFSTLGRTAARAIDAVVAADLMVKYVDDLTANIKGGDEVAANMEKWDPSTWPKECKGVGLCEAPRGALSHWCVIKDGKIANWQAVVPTTWNACPRDAKVSTARSKPLCSALRSSIRRSRSRSFVRSTPSTRASPALLIFSTLRAKKLRRSNPSKEEPHEN